MTYVYTGFLHAYASMFFSLHGRMIQPAYTYDLFVFGHKLLASSGPLGVNFSFLSGLFMFRHKFLALSGPLWRKFLILEWPIYVWT